MPELVASVSLHFAAGDDLLLEFTVTDADGDAVDITGFTAEFAIFRNLGDTAVIETEDTATSELTDPTSGVYTIAVDGDDTDALLGTYRFESAVTDGSDHRSTVSRGYVTFEGTHF